MVVLRVSRLHVRALNEALCDATDSRPTCNVGREGVSWLFRIELREPADRTGHARVTSTRASRSERTRGSLPTSSGGVAESMRMAALAMSPRLPCRRRSGRARCPSHMLPIVSLALVATLALACSHRTPSPASPSSPAPEQPQTASPPAHGAHHQPGFHKDFSDAQGFSAHFDDPARDAWQHPNAVVDLMRIPPSSTVVDLGAGTGYFVGALAQRVGADGKVLALDIEPKMIEFLERRVKEQGLTNVEPRLVTPDTPGLAPASVSRILIVNTWHHIDNRPVYTRQLAPALTPAGEIWIVDFTLDSTRGPPAQYRLPAEQVVRELEQGGLRAQIVEPEPLPEQYIVRASR
jgi:hypothetical protein